MLYVSYYGTISGVSMFTQVCHRYMYSRSN